MDTEAVVAGLYELVAPHLTEKQRLGRGSNGYRVRAWKTQLARLAAETGLEVTVCHFPPGTSKWNRIEHRLFSHVSMNWRGRPLVSHEVIAELIAATWTRSGLRVHAERDLGRYPLGVEVSAGSSLRCRCGGTTGTGSGTTPCSPPPHNRTGEQPCRAGTFRSGQPTTAGAATFSPQSTRALQRRPIVPGWAGLLPLTWRAQAHHAPS